MKKTPWREMSNTIDEYINPQYYNKIIKKYSFGGKSDLKLFSDWLKITNKNNILELGSGTGRCTDILLNKIGPKNAITLVDLSDKMIQYAKNKYSSLENLAYKNNDSLQFLETTDNQYDIVYSLWSLSHSTHQHIHNLGFKKGYVYIKSVLTKFIDKNMPVGSEFFLIHFDSMSEEQSTLMEQWGRVFPEFKNSNSIQSPSKRIIEEVLIGLDNLNKIKLSIIHLEGDPIIYKDEEDLLENYMNFHLETYFNLNDTSKEVECDLILLNEKFKNKNGEYTIKPGCYIYKFKKYE